MRITFKEALQAIRAPRAWSPPRHIDECLEALKHETLDLAEHLPSLAAKHAKSKRTQGQIIVECLRGVSAEALARDPDLCADCYLGLAAWVLDWNRRQLRRVA